MVSEQRAQQGRAYERTLAGAWGVTQAESDAAAERESVLMKETVRAQLQQIDVIQHNYRSLVSRFLVQLTTHADPNMRLLAVRLDFNEFHSLDNAEVARATQNPEGASGGGERDFRRGRML